MKRFPLCLVALICLAVSGCAKVSKISAWGHSHHVKQFSGGKIVGEWDSVGAIENEEQSDGFYFEDRLTHSVVRVSGEAQITVNP